MKYLLITLKRIAMDYIYVQIARVIELFKALCFKSFRIAEAAPINLYSSMRHPKH